MQDQSVRTLSAEAVWNDTKMGKATVFKSEHLMLGLNALEPGQAHAAHAHEGSDKAYLVLSGIGRFELGDEKHDMEAGQLLVAPAGVPHGVENQGDERLLVFVAMAPSP